MAEKPPPAHAFEPVALMAALMEAMRTARRPLRPVLMERYEGHHECGLDLPSNWLTALNAIIDAL